MQTKIWVAFPSIPCSAPTSIFGAKIKGNLIKDIESIILAKAPGSSKLTMYHSITNLGDSRSKPTNKYVHLLGFGPDATAVIFDKTSIVAAIEEACPTTGLLKNISESVSVATSNILGKRPYNLK